MRALILASLLLPTLALATPESDRLAALEARLAALESQSTSPAAPSPRVTPSPRRVTPQYVNVAKQLLGYKFAAFGSPIFAYPGYGGGSGGGGAVTSANMPDPYTPTDGTWNLTGSLRTSTNITADGDLNVAGSTASFTSLGHTISGAAGEFRFSGRDTDDANAIALRFSAHNDLTTAGAKIASFGDNAGTSYAEKLYVDKDGLVVNAAATAIWLQAGASAGYGFGHSANQAGIYANSALSAQFDVGGITIPNNKTIAYTPGTLTIADNGNGGTAATHTALPTAGMVRVTCSDANGCEWTITETSATTGECHLIYNASANNLVMKNAAGADLYVGGADQTLGQNDGITVCYDSTISAWLGETMMNR